MKKLILVCSFAILGITATFAQTEPKLASAKEEVKKDGPKIEFNTTEINYGDIEYKADGNREFKFTNTGNAPLIITNAKGSCGCTVPTAPLNKPIAPGESSVIKVRYATNRVGHFTKTVTITSNAVNQPSAVLRIKGTVGPNPDAKPTANK